MYDIQGIMPNATFKDRSGVCSQVAMQSVLHDPQIQSLHYHYTPFRFAIPYPKASR